MIFHENRLLADDSHEISFLIPFELGNMSNILSSVAVVIGLSAEFLTWNHPGDILDSFNIYNLLYKANI